MGNNLEKQFCFEKQIIFKNSNMKNSFDLFPICNTFLIAQTFGLVFGGKNFNKGLMDNDFKKQFCFEKQFPLIPKF